jgi:hypothetical protein
MRNTGRNLFRQAENLNIIGVILKLILKAYILRVRTGIIWLKTEISGGSFLTLSFH